MSAARVFSWALRLLLAGVFAYAGVMKLLDPRSFADEIRNYQLLPALAPHLAVSLPSLELVTAIGLLVPTLRRAAAVLAAVLMTVFLGAVASVVVRHVDIACGCFGHDSSNVTWLSVARNVGLLAAAAYLVLPEGAVAPIGMPNISPNPGSSATSSSGDERTGRPG